MLKKASVAVKMQPGNDAGLSWILKKKMIQTLQPAQNVAEEFV